MKIYTNYYIIKLGGSYRILSDTYKNIEDCLDNIIDMSKTDDWCYKYTVIITENNKGEFLEKVDMVKSDYVYDNHLDLSYNFMTERKDD